jgi:hypothetical protein
MRPGRAHSGDRGTRPRPELEVSRDQGAVEVESERGDALRELVRELYGALPPVESTT